MRSIANSIAEFPYDSPQATRPYYYSRQNYAYIPTFLKRLLVVVSRASWKRANMAEKSTKVQSNLKNNFFNISNNKVEQKKTICRINLPTVKEDKEHPHFTWFKVGEKSKNVADELKWTIIDIKIL